MRSNALSNEQAGLRRAALAGVVSGLRSQTQLAMLARSIDEGETAPPSGQLGALFRSPAARRALQIAAVGEAIVDKLPIAPSRLKPLPFLGRLGFGAVSAAALAQTQQTPVVQAAIRGAGGAAIGSVGGYLFRTVIGKASGLPAPLVALVEDAIAVGLARSAIRPEALSELASEQTEQAERMQQTEQVEQVDQVLPTSSATTNAAPATSEPPAQAPEDPTATLPDAGEAGTEAPTAPPPSA